MTVATEPNTAALAQSVEASFLNPLKTAGDAYRKAAAYVAALPETSDSDKVGSLRSWFLSGAEKLKDRTLRPSEMDYIHGKCAHAALEIGFYRGDIAYDWRH